MRYHDIDHGFVDLAISRRPEIQRYRTGMHISHVHGLPVQTERTYWW